MCPVFYVDILCYAARIGGRVPLVRDRDCMEDTWRLDSRVPPICGNYYHHAQTSSGLYSCLSNKSPVYISDPNSPSSPQTVILGYESERSLSPCDRPQPYTARVNEDMYHDNHNTQERPHYARSKSAAPALNRHKTSGDSWPPSHRPRSCSPPTRTRYSW